MKTRANIFQTSFFVAGCWSMALLSPFQLPDELLISSLCIDFPCREPQIRSLVSLLSVRPSAPLLSLTYIVFSSM